MVGSEHRVTRGSLVPGMKDAADIRYALNGFRGLEMPQLGPTPTCLFSKMLLSPHPRADAPTLILGGHLHSHTQTPPYIHTYIIKNKNKL